MNQIPLAQRDPVTCYGLLEKQKRAGMRKLIHKSDK